MGSIILDITMIFIAVLAAYIGWVNGFAKTLVSFLGFFVSLFGGIVLTPELSQKMLPYVRAALDSDPKVSGVVSLAGKELTASLVARAISFAAVFIGVCILIAIVKAILKKLFKYPVLKKADSFIGMLLGTLSGYFVISVLCLALFASSELLVGLFDFVTPELFEESIVARLIYEHNIFGLIISLGQ